MTRKMGRRHRMDPKKNKEMTVLGTITEAMWHFPSNPANVLDPFQVSLSQGASKKGTGAAFWCCEDHFDASTPKPRWRRDALARKGREQDALDNAESMEDGTGLV